MELIQSTESKFKLVENEVPREKDRILKKKQGKMGSVKETPIEHDVKINVEVAIVWQ